MSPSVARMPVSWLRSQKGQAFSWWRMVSGFWRPMLISKFMRLMSMPDLLSGDCRRFLQRNTGLIGVMMI